MTQRTPAFKVCLFCKKYEAATLTMFNLGLFGFTANECKISKNHRCNNITQPLLIEAQQCSKGSQGKLMNRYLLQWSIVWNIIWSQGANCSVTLSFLMNIWAKMKPHPHVLLLTGCNKSFENLKYTN